MNELQPIAQALAQAGHALEPDSTIHLPLDDGRCVRVCASPQGLVVSAVQSVVGLPLAEIAARRDALACLAPADRWMQGRVASVDAQGCDVLSAVIDPRACSQAFEALLRDLFEYLEAVA